jgi:hypothetical protein
MAVIRIGQQGSHDLTHWLTALVESEECTFECDCCGSVLVLVLKGSHQEKEKKEKKLQGLGM